MARGRQRCGCSRWQSRRLWEVLWPRPLSGGDLDCAWRGWFSAWSLPSLSKTLFLILSFFLLICVRVRTPFSTRRSWRHLAISRHFWWLQQGVCYWLVVGRGQRCFEASYSAQEAPQQRLTGPKCWWSPTLEASKQSVLTKAEDTGLRWTEFYSASKNPNDLLAEFLFLKPKAHKEPWHVKQRKVGLLSGWAVGWHSGSSPAQRTRNSQDLKEQNLKNTDTVQTPYFIDEKLRALRSEMTSLSCYSKSLARKPIVGRPPALHSVGPMLRTRKGKRICHVAVLFLMGFQEAELCLNNHLIQVGEKSSC